MGSAKARGTDEEVYVLIFLKRERALEAMDKIVKGLSFCPWHEPTFALLLEYISNMISVLELMLKLLSGNWQSHEVGKMYETVFGSPHPDSDFMACLKQALRDQKYFLLPSADPSQPNGRTIAHYIPEIEGLFDLFKQKFCEQHEKALFHREILLPVRIGEFLRDNVWKFFKGRTYTARDMPVDVEQMQRQYEEQLESAALMIDEYLKMRKGLGVAEGKGHSIYGLR
jgi:hypothetical protein